MRYADSCCTVRESYDPHTYTFTGRCVVTDEEYSVTVKAKELFAYRAGALIQDAMPSLSKDDREFLLSGMSPKGWEQAFGDSDE